MAAKKRAAAKKTGAKKVAAKKPSSFRADVVRHSASKDGMDVSATNYTFAQRKKGRDYYFFSAPKKKNYR